MAWKSREDKLPPPAYFSLIAAYLQRAYPGARISREMMTTLRPFFIEAWRLGKGAEGAAQSTCACDGRQIVPSPVVGIHIARGSVRPPKGAQRGEVFGVEALRPPAQLERLEQKLGRIDQQQKKAQATSARYQHQASTSRQEGVRQTAAQKHSTATAKYAELKDEAQRIETEIQRLRSALNRTSLPVTPSVPSSTKSQPSGSPARKGVSLPAADAQSQAMLTAIQGMLPNIAGQLATQMAKEGKAK